MRRLIERMDRWYGRSAEFTIAVSMPMATKVELPHLAVQHFQFFDRGKVRDDTYNREHSCLRSAVLER
jgi:hypothetical protein